jgi:transcriptional regulator NrdR family protein
MKSLSSKDPKFDHSNASTVICKKETVTRCRKCNEKTVRVIDSRGSHFLGKITVRRRRKCMNCEFTYTTYEVESEIVDLVKQVKKLKRIIKEIYNLNLLRNI